MKRFITLLAIIIVSVTICQGASRPNGTTRFQTLSAHKVPLPSLELDTEFNNLVDSINSMSLNIQNSEWFQPSYVATYASATSFTVPGNKAEDFPQHIRVKFILSGGTVYSSVNTSVYTSGTNTTTITIQDNFLTNPINSFYFSVVKPYAFDGSVSPATIFGYVPQSSANPNQLVVRDYSGRVVGDITGNANYATTCSAATTATTAATATAATSATNATNASNSDTLDGFHAVEIPLALAPVGSVIGYASSSTSTYINTISTPIPSDSTPPQSGEGTQILTVTYAAKKAASKLIITANIYQDPYIDFMTGVNPTVAAIFHNGSVYAIASARAKSEGSLVLTKEYAPGTTSPVIYSVRVGTGVVNPLWAGVGLGTSTLTIMEIAQ